LQKLRN